MFNQGSYTESFTPSGGRKPAFYSTFTGSERAGQRAAAIQTLLGTAQLNSQASPLDQTTVQELCSLKLRE